MDAADRFFAAVLTLVMLLILGGIALALLL
jgi:hypothetical protein